MTLTSCPLPLPSTSPLLPFLSSILFGKSIPTRTAFFVSFKKKIFLIHWNCMSYSINKSRIKHTTTIDRSNNNIISLPFVFASYHRNHWIDSKMADHRNRKLHLHSDHDPKKTSIQFKRKFSSNGFSFFGIHFHFLFLTKKLKNWFID